MTMQLFLSMMAGLVVIIGLLFLSMIHLFMIPSDVRKRDTDVRPKGEDDMIDRIEKPEMGGDLDHEPKPEIEREPDIPGLEPKPEPEIKREPGITEDPKPEADPQPAAPSPDY